MMVSLCSDAEASITGMAVQREMATLTLYQGAASTGREIFTAATQDSAVGGRIEPASVPHCCAESCQWQRGCYPTATGLAPMNGVSVMQVSSGVSSGSWAVRP